MLYYFSTGCCSASSVSGCVSHSTQTVVGLVFRGKRKGTVHSNTHIFFSCFLCRYHLDYFGSSVATKAFGEKAQGEI